MAVSSKKPIWDLIKKKWVIRVLELLYAFRNKPQELPLEWEPTWSQITRRLVIPNKSLKTALDALVELRYVEQTRTGNGRKYYSITKKGEKHFIQQRDGLKGLFEAVIRILEGGDNASI